ncbi:MAG: hypothetical protein KF797_05285 [Flavobacteriales bacterium]|nr:hypothetical protein [Flavobacteriales bacterium]
MEPILISGAASIWYHSQEFIVERDGDEVLNVYEIRFEGGAGAFKEALKWGSILVVGHGACVYLYDVKEGKALRTLSFDGYFGHLYVFKDLLYVAGDHELYCLGGRGDILWKRDNLGIDGVIIEACEKDILYGAGEWDPPGGWRSFRLNSKTGERLP